ncbi:MAG: hypothetical protein ABI134_24925 [Byssovorax sp.]
MRTILSLQRPARETCMLRAGAFSLGTLVGYPPARGFLRGKSRREVTPPALARDRRRIDTASDLR